MKDILLGLILFMAGLVLYLFPPKRINSFYGYRTFNSMKNIDNWKTANQYSSKLLMILGLIVSMVGYFTSTIWALVTLVPLIGILFILVEWRISK